MVDGNYYVENPANSNMHYDNKPIVGVLDFPEHLPVKRPYNYFEAQAIYNGLTKDIYELSQKGDPDKVKKGVPKIIKYALGILASIPLIILGAKGISKIIAKFRH